MTIKPLLLIIFILLELDLAESLAAIPLHKNSDRSKEISLLSNLDPNLGSQLVMGTGYDTLSGDVKGDCVIRSVPQITSEGLAAVTAELKYIDSYKKLGESLEISAATNVKLDIAAYNLTLSGVAKYFREHMLEENSIYFMIKVLVACPKEKMLDVTLKPEFVSLLKGSGGNEAFRKTCGDEFVVTTQKGGIFYALVKIETKDENDKRLVELAIRGSVGIFSTAGEGIFKFQERINSIIKDRKIELFIHQEGGIIDDIPFSIYDIENLLNHAKKFAKNIRNNGGGAPILSIAEPYTNLINYPREASPIRTGHKQNVIKILSNNRYDFLEKITHLEFILKNPQVFMLPSDPTELNSLFSLIQTVRDQYVKNLSIMANFADDCFWDIDKCRLPTKEDGFLFPSLPIIKKKESIGITNAPEEICLEWLYKEGKSEVCGVKEYHLGRGPICGVEKYNEKRNELCGIELYHEKRDPSICGITLLLLSMHECEDYIKKGQNWITWQGSSCVSKNACRSPHFGVELYKACRLPQFGVENYNLCTHPIFGVKEYSSCRHISFGKERCISTISNTSSFRPSTTGLRPKAD